MYDFLSWIPPLACILVLLFFTNTKANFIMKFAYLYSAYMCMGVIMTILCLPRPRHPDNGVLAAKIMKYINKMVGITWTIEGSEHLSNDSGAVVIMNHQSSIDVIAMFEIWPILKKAAPVAKKSLLYAGPFGLGCWLLGVVFIDRSSKTSHRDVNSAGAKAMNEGLKLMIFPEGTRNSSKNLSMLPFKKGAFHVALSAQMPIIPVVISEYSFLDVRKWIFKPGHAVIKVLPPIATSEYSKENLDDLVDSTRSKMIETLAELDKREK